MPEHPTDDEQEVQSITEAAHERGADGKPMAVTEEVEFHGSTWEVDIYPATTGERNEWIQRLEGEDEELSEEVTEELLDEFAVPDPSDFGGAESWSDVRPVITDAIGNAILARMFDAGDPDEFAQSLADLAEESVEGNES